MESSTKSYLMETFVPTMFLDIQKHITESAMMSMKDVNAKSMMKYLTITSSTSKGVPTQWMPMATIYP